MSSLPLRECGLKSCKHLTLSHQGEVTPLAGVWIEIEPVRANTVQESSLPLRECGLKCYYTTYSDSWQLSLPLRECGLKYYKFCTSPCREWSLPLRECGLKYLAAQYRLLDPVSLPLRECGLKFLVAETKARLLLVTPLAGVWIEITIFGKEAMAGMCHSPCGSVD